MNRFRYFNELKLKTLTLNTPPPRWLHISKTFYTLKFIKLLDFSHEFIYRAYRFLPQTQWPLIFIVICPRVFLPISILIVLFSPVSSDDNSFAVQQQWLFSVDVFKKLIIITVRIDERHIKIPYASTVYNLVIIGHRWSSLHRIQDTTRIKHDRYVTFYIFFTV